MAYLQIFYHIIFRTKFSERTIPEIHAPKLYRYIYGIIRNKNCHLYRINGMPDHLHIFSDLHPSMALSDYIKDIKVSSSKMMKNSEYFPGFNGWASKYCALSYSLKEKDLLINYIKNQQIHHKKETFKEEMARIFRENGIVDDGWFWVDN